MFTVAAADVVGEIFTGFDIDIPGELPFCTAGWTGVAGGGGFIGFEGVGHGGLRIADCGMRIAE